MDSCVKRAQIFVWVLLQNESIMLVEDFTRNFNEVCPIKFDNVKQSLDNLHPPSSTEPKHAIFIQVTKVVIYNINQRMLIMPFSIHMIK